MKERSILFRADMVVAILYGRKTQTRRVLKEQCSSLTPSRIAGAPFGGPRYEWRTMHDQHAGYVAGLHEVGSRLWVREAWRAEDVFDGVPPRDIPTGAPVQYEAGRARSWDRFDWIAGRYRHARFMPRWASRLTLEVTDVRCERLQDISQEDAVAEGCHPDHWHHPTPRDRFRDLWSSIYGAIEWEENPWVAAYTFRKVTP